MSSPIWNIFIDILPKIKSNSWNHLEGAKLDKLTEISAPGFDS